MLHSLKANLGKFKFMILGDKLSVIKKGPILNLPKSQSTF